LLLEGNASLRTGAELLHNIEVVRRLEVSHLLFILFGEEGAGCIDNGAAGSQMRKRGGKNRSLLLDQLGEEGVGESVFEVGVSPECSSATAGDVEEEPIHLAAERSFGKAKLHILNAGSPHALAGLGESGGAGVVEKELPLSLHAGGNRERLATRAGAVVEHEVAGTDADELSYLLARLILHLKQPCEKFGEVGEMLGTLKDNPIGGVGGGAYVIEASPFFKESVTRNLEGIGAKSERGSLHTGEDEFLGRLFSVSGGEVSLERLGGRFRPEESVDRFGHGFPIFGAQGVVAPKIEAEELVQRPHLDVERLGNLGGVVRTELFNRHGKHYTPLQGGREGGIF
jgi:hypothetical protein